MILYNECPYCKLKMFTEYHQYYCKSKHKNIETCHDCKLGMRIIHEKFHEACERIKNG